MSQKLKNKIEANDTSIKLLLKDEKFYIDYFQREYRWEEKHIKTLIEDLTNTFLKSYKEGDRPEDVANYQNYYLGPVVFSVNPDTAKKSIIDGQQRITSITLLLIYLNHQQRNFEEEEKVSISDLIFSVKHRVKSFNMTDENREDCLKALFEIGSYVAKDDDDETIINMVDRYHDIHDSFPEEINAKALPYFIDWFVENVVIVEITAYSDENAYTIFETMNDRGLNLTPTEMLKGYVLSKITDRKKRNEINDIWKAEMIKLHDYSKNADQSFFHAWFRAKYAVSIRPGKAGSQNQDFELIGTGFHSWFKDNHSDLFDLNNAEEFYTFFKDSFPFFVKYYLKAWKARQEFEPRMPHLTYINSWGIADSLQEPMLMAAINHGEKEELIFQKIDAVARFIETFTVRRSVNYKKFGQTAIKYTMFNIIKLIRNNELNDLYSNLSKEINDIPQNWSAVQDFRLHGMNRKFVKHLLSRISSHMDKQVGKDTSYVAYHHPKGKQFEIEHIWADKFDEHKSEFDQLNDFRDWRNKIGALILLPNGTNQSFNSDRYEDKIQHYLKENTYAQTLHSSYYEKNPNFLNSNSIKSLGFKHHDDFKKSDIVERTALVERICEQIWATDYFQIEHQ
ncbi:Uncharacterized conserved protein, contains ParB-like and HNH nuclease domains [Maribacter dokdonensis]|uniref:Uncharacterized conserved protein, contains ParB-like and HNH nuclease domains n=1 Tax=Maribacter dokdonensis TaxID=320912 RepID=A0A1H4M7W3_9FLAO|nr:DUF262 domain-containing protein [Maribacter dokdonensis]SEB79171.1 Uncharacterized conserved protein, contains ParB-like and HNH nuclease domains [Maribacter dokdonensis]